MARDEYILVNRSKRSFGIALFSGILLAITILYIILSTYFNIIAPGETIFFYDWKSFLIMIGISFAGFVFSFIVKAVEKIEERW